MGSTKIEYLDARRPQKTGAPRRRGALRHLDAAHAKLEKLRTWRRQLKQDYEERVEERDTALVALENTLRQLDEKTRALDEALIVVSTQKGLIVQLLDELAEQEDAAEVATSRSPTTAEPPALTARVLGKISPKGWRST